MITVFACGFGIARSLRLVASPSPDETELEEVPVKKMSLKSLVKVLAEEHQTSIRQYEWV
jgi:hypothetical protein